MRPDWLERKLAVVPGFVLRYARSVFSLFTVAVYALAFVYDNGVYATELDRWLWATAVTFATIFYLVAGAPQVFGAEDGPDAPVAAGGGAWLNAALSIAPVRYIGRLSYQICARSERSKGVHIRFRRVVRRALNI
jgi:peptidoglycan/LPS O-acetylase OafA/YrhL